MAEWVGFEPTDAFTSLVFKTSTLNRSDTTPLFVNIIALFRSAVNTLEQIFRLELKIKLYKSLVIPLNYICFEFSSIYLCMKSLMRLVPFLSLSWAALINAARISPLTLMFIFLSCTFKLINLLKNSVSCCIFDVVFSCCIVILTLLMPKAMRFFRRSLLLCRKPYSSRRCQLPLHGYSFRISAYLKYLFV